MLVHRLVMFRYREFRIRYVTRTSSSTGIRKMRFAFIVVTRATSSTDNPLISAIRFATRGTYEGSFFLPRCGTGARNGLSVSVRIFSRGRGGAPPRRAGGALGPPGRPVGEEVKPRFSDRDHLVASREGVKARQQVLRAAR